MTKIPKIIHHIAPADPNRWHPIWQRCYLSWKKHFSDFEFRLWNDQEDIDNLVRKEFPQYWSMYQRFPVHIMRIDFARFCILHQLGGIYTDMDVFCYKNFYHELDGEVHLLPAPYGQQATNGDNLIENALMASVPRHNFFKQCMEKSLDIFDSQISKINIQFPLSVFHQALVVNTAGPVLVSNVFSKYSTGVKILNPLTYNNHGLSYDPSYRTKHLLTGLWGEEAIDLKSHDEYIIEISQYSNMSGVTLDTFDFYTDYTNGGYLKK